MDKQLYEMAWTVPTQWKIPLILIIACFGLGLLFLQYDDSRITKILFIGSVIAVLGSLIFAILCS